MAAKAALLLGVLATAAADPDCGVHWVGGKRTTVCTEVVGGGATVELTLTCHYDGWVGFGFRPKDSQQGMAMTDFVVIDYEGTPTTGYKGTVRDMYARTNGQPKDDGCASDWELVAQQFVNKQRKFVLRRSTGVADTNQDHAFVPGEMTFLLAHGGAKGDWKMANHGTARKQWATAAEPTAADPNFGDETKPAVCGTPAPPTINPEAPCVSNPCGSYQECVEELPTFVCVCKINSTQRAEGKQVEVCSKTTTDGKTTTTVVIKDNTKTTTTTTSGSPLSEGGASDSDGLSGGAIAGIVVGVVVGLAVVGAAVWYFAFRSAGSGAEGPEQDTAMDKQLPCDRVV